ncbi:MAG TPA: hypothetical protein VHS78_04700 [Candidatus Elarobacter sp.]|jgi:hypothetical protein|nr:hypothetical protein [Candidatus Elarobacter sp.]
MRSPLVAAAFLLSLAAPAGAQSAAAAPATAPSCTAREANLGGIGRASVVSFTGPVFGARVCATVANLAIDGFSARVADAPPSDALVTAALGSGTGDVTLPLDGVTVTGVGPYVVAPGGLINGFGADTSEAPRVVLAYAGQRVLVIGTSPVELLDLARILRTQPALFGTDAVERAVLLASGPDAAISLNTSDGVFGAAAVGTPRTLVLIKRG